MSQKENTNQEKETIQDQAKQVASEGMSRIKKAAIALLSVVLAIILTLGLAFLIARRQYKQFTNNAELENKEVLALARSAIKGSFQQVANDKNLTLLLLGTDETANREHLPPLTDTMILLNYRNGSNTINSVSLPRDLWNQPYQTKINALYTYGLDRNPSQPDEFPKQVLEEMTGVQVDYTFIISLEQLAELIDIVGGIEVNIEQGFTDKEFPRSDVDIKTEHDPKKLYETVTFKAGVEQMDGERALKFIRSRHSNDDQGTDIARSQRQQQVLNSLIDKISDKQSLLLNPGTLGKLYKFYQDNLSQYLSTKELAILFYSIRGQLAGITFTNHSLPISPDNKEGVIYHPQPAPAWQNQWVYLVKDDSLFKDFIQTKLELK